MFANIHCDSTSLTIIKQTDKFEVDIYRKETYSGRYIDGKSCHPLNQKYSAIYALAYRAVFLPLNYIDRLKEINLLKHTATINNLDPNIVNKAITKFNRIKSIKNATHLLPIRKYDQNDKIIHSKLPYYPIISEEISKIGYKYNINFGMKPTNTLKSYFPKLKHSQNKYEKSGVYELKCKDCNCSYIGQTSRNFGIRMKEHEASIRLNHPEKSHYAKHVLDLNHNKNLSTNDMDILEFTNDYHIRNFKETYYIKARKQAGSCVNIDDGPYTTSRFVDFTYNLLNS